MITSLPLTALLVRDYDEAKEFYCEKLGFDLVEDTPLVGGKRWVRLRTPGGGGAELLLSRAVDAKQRAVVGNQAGGRVLFFFDSDDVQADYWAFRAKGVVFSQTPIKADGRTVAVLKDLYGNRIDLIQLV